MYASFMAVGWFASRRVREGTAADLIVAGRAMPFWVAALTMTATWVDGGYLLGTTEGAYKSSLQLGIQGGLCFGISLILGGVFFAAIMRRFEFTTLIDPLEARFGKRWAAVLFLPALAGELFWSAELLVAIGSTFGVLLGMPLTTAILLSAVVTTAYTVLGGMWSVAYTDIFQLGLVALGLAAALPYVLDGARPALQPEVRDHEPAVALYGGREGLDLVTRLAAEAPRRLRGGGYLVFEFGLGQDVEIEELIWGSPDLELIELRRDLQGIARTVVARRR